MALQCRCEPIHVLLSMDSKSGCFLAEETLQNNETHMRKEQANRMDEDLSSNLEAFQAMNCKQHDRPQRLAGGLERDVPKLVSLRGHIRCQEPAVPRGRLLLVQGMWRRVVRATNQRSPLGQLFRDAVESHVSIASQVRFESVVARAVRKTSRIEVLLPCRDPGLLQEQTTL